MDDEEEEEEREKERSGVMSSQVSKKRSITYSAGRETSYG